MNEHIAGLVAAAVKDAFAIEITPLVSRPEPQFGDFATNVALQLGKQLGRPPREIAGTIATQLGGQDEFKEATIAGPGFINLRLGDAALRRGLHAAVPQRYAGQVIVSEYSGPNPFKVLHVGHLYTSIVGDAIANILEASGARVHRTNFGGDVGLHVGKTMWALLSELGGERPEKLHEIAEDQRSEWMAAAYVRGSQAYEDDETARQEIVALNKRVYRLHASADRGSPFADIYWTCRQWSYDYFDAFYERIGTPFEKYYPESSVASLGEATVREQLAAGVYKESDGAVVFKGEPYGLHTRVFITSEGLPTYEAKDVGVLMQKWRDYKFDWSMVLTGNDIAEYMKVVLASVSRFAPELAGRSRHLTHGNVRLAGGVKMSSRKGNFLRAAEVLDIAAQANRSQNGQDDEQVVLGAVKYAFLKQRLGADIVYLPDESVSLEGNSGPYLQYAHARARSILAKAPESVAEPADVAFEAHERSLALKLAEYPEVVGRAAQEYLPHHICSYLYELAQTFNRFYEHSRVLGDPREALRLGLVRRYADVLRAGLRLLGIPAPERL